MTEVERQHMYSEFDTWLSSHDLIIFEDIHKFQEHPLLAKQMFWQINSLLHARKKVVFTSRCLPDEINNIEARLRSRLNSCQILNLSYSLFYPPYVGVSRNRTPAIYLCRKILYYGRDYKI